MEIDKNTKKQNFLLEKDTANTEFSQFLKKKKKSIIELTIDIPLYGNLNLSLLSDNGFTKIEILIFSEGSLTTITNIPSSIRVLIASNQTYLRIKTTVEEPIKKVKKKKELDKLASPSLESFFRDEKNELIPKTQITKMDGGSF